MHAGYVYEQSSRFKIASKLKTAKKIFNTEESCERCLIPK